MLLISHPVKQPLSGDITVPGDKSVSHRAVILATLAKGTSHISGWLDAEDTQATLAACIKLGAKIEWQQLDGKPLLSITGTSGVLNECDEVLDLGNSGTGVRLLLGVLAGQKLSIGFTGDDSLRQRPMGRIVKPLQQMGARFVYTQPSDEKKVAVCLPLKSLGPESDQLTSIDYEMPVASAQVQAAVLLAGLQANDAVSVRQPGLCRDHSERMLRLFGARLQRIDQCHLKIWPGQLLASTVQVPGDFSSAAFLLQAALLVPGSLVSIQAVGINPTRTGLLEVISQMGGQVQLQADATVEHAEPTANLQAKYSRLNGIQVSEALVPNCIDEFPMIMAMAAVSNGMTRIRGAAELRVKESDRIAVMATALQVLGTVVTEYPDGVDIIGGDIDGGEVDAHGDHRIAMSLAVLGLIARRPIRIHNAQAIATSYPQFVKHLNVLGAQLQWQV